MLRAFILMLVVTCGIIGVAWYMMGNADQQKNEQETKERVDAGFLSTRKEFNDKKEDYKRRREEMLVQIGRLESREKEASREFRQLGVKTAQALNDNPAAKRQYESIRRYKADVKKLKGDVELFDETIAAIETALDDLDRKLLMENVAVNDETYRQLRTIVLDVDSKLSRPESALEAFETQATLDEILGDADEL